MNRIVLLVGAGIVLGIGTWWFSQSNALPAWTPTEVQILRSLWLGALPPLPADPSNRVADDARAVKLGHRLFFDTRLSANGEVACASCHKPERMFTDGRALAQGVGRTARNSMSIVGAAYSPWLFWDGRKDSLWSQALGPLESPQEHGGTRTQHALVLAEDDAYKADYVALFGPLPPLSNRTRFPAFAGPDGNEEMRAAWQAMSPADRDAVSRVYANIGKAIAAYERRLLPGPSRFDDYVQAVLESDEATQITALSSDEVAGLRLFIGDAQCIRCHNGPLFTNNEFHNTGVLSAPGMTPDEGRVGAVREARADPFNCLGAHSDDGEHECAELRFARTGRDLMGAMRTPSLRNVASTGPYMHAGQLATLADVLDHYNRAPSAMIGHNEANPLDLGTADLRRLEAFLRTLSGPLAVSPEWLAPPP
ncbi:MAG: cytochrome-c peroxidase [Gammaproteobacteria bacterium]